MKVSLSGTLATMCPAIPYSIAAKFAFSDRMPIALIGDGAMQMLGINGMITIAAHWKQWSDPRFMILVLNNQDLNMVSWEQRITESDKKFKASQDVPQFNYAAYGQLLGFEGIRIEKEDDVIPGLEQALAAKRPVVVDVLSDPNVPPLPPHISIKQMKDFTSALIKGDTNFWGMIKQTYNDVVETYLIH